MKSPSEWEGRAASHGGNAGEEAEAAAGRKESEEKNDNNKADTVSKLKALGQQHTDLRCDTVILFSQAASRGWSSYHTVLHRHTLCFYQDRKDTLRVSHTPPAMKEAQEKRDGQRCIWVGKLVVIRLFCLCRARRVACR